MEREIVISYRKIIDTMSSGAWEKMVFEDSYQEFRMQAQYYNQQNNYRTYSQLVHHTKAADNLAFLVSASITPYMQQLNGLIPDVFNTVGKQFLSFTNYKFEIINSSLDDKTAHQVAINFYSNPLRWHDTIDGLLLVSPAHQIGECRLTDMMRLQPFVSIHSLKNQQRYAYDVAG